MTEQYESSEDRSKLVDLALKYTNNDLNTAKEMASDQYLDVTVVKGRFLVGEKGYSGVFLAFFNHIQNYIANVTSIISSKTFLYDKTRISDGWKILYKDIMEYIYGSDLIDSKNFNYFLVDSFAAYDVFPDVKDQRLDELSTVLSEIISKSLNADAVKCQIEFETTSSLAMELTGVLVDIPGGEKGELPDLPQDDRIAQIESEAKYVIDGVAVVSPVKGKNISELNAGDKIRLLLPGKDVVSEKILKMLNAYDANGQRLPIAGRVKTKLPIEKGGYILYAIVAKGVLAKIYEEENVKIMMYSPHREQKQEKVLMDKWMIYAMGIVVGLIIVCGIILFQIL
jgi:hypothetical protein